MRNLIACGAILFVALCGTVSAQTLLYSFETLYSNPDNPIPDPTGTLPDGFTFNGGGTEISQDTFGATDGTKSMKFLQIQGPTFTGAITALGAPFDLINDPTTFAVSLDFTIKPGEEYTGTFANLGITEFGEHPTLGEGNAQTVPSAEQPINLPAGTYHLIVPLIARFNPYTFDLDVSFSSIAGPTANPRMTGTSFQFYINKASAGTFTAYVDNVRAVGQPTSAWNFDGDGNWSDDANWLGFPTKVPNGANSIALLGLGPPLSAGRTITLTQPITLGRLQFNSSNPYTVAGASALSLDVTSGQANINVVNGSHFIASPLVLNDDTTVTVSRATDLLRVDGPLTATGRTITKLGPGAAQFENIRATGLNAANGVVRISQKLTAGDPAGTSKLTALTIAIDASLDVTNNATIIDYTGTTPLPQILALLDRGYAEGSWNGTGINSSTAAATAGAAVGYAEASDLFTTFPNTYAGQSVDATSIVIAYTLAGDANLDRIVDIGDFALLAANFNQPVPWVRGNFNYDGLADIGDFALLASKFNQAASRSAVPEPSSLMVVVSAFLAMWRGRGCRF